MRSARHKVLHQLAGQSMLWHVLTALREAGIAPDRTTVVIGDSAAGVRDEVERCFPAGNYHFAVQEQQLGTGHATLQARPHVPLDTDTIVVAYGDTPLLRAGTVRSLLSTHRSHGKPVTLVTGRLDDPQDLGRIVRDNRDEIAAIVEARDATEAQRAIREVNSGFCAFSASWLWDHLDLVAPAPNGEIYLTALAGIAVASGHGAGALVLDDVVETVGVNTRAQQASAEAKLRHRLVDAHMESGVTFQDPATAYLDAGVQIGPDTVVLANTHLMAGTRIGAGCVVGPNAIVRASIISDRCRVFASVLDGAELEEDVSVGPFAHLRPGARCGRGVHVGTGSEIKASTLGEGSKMQHFGYLGDAVIGAGVNVGAGTVTCNFDGENKHATHVHDGAFIGSGSLLVAPVTVGAGALTGAGSVVLKDVPEATKVAGVPARQIGARTGKSV